MYLKPNDTSHDFVPDVVWYRTFFKTVSDGHSSMAIVYGHADNTKPIVLLLRASVRCEVPIAFSQS